MEGLIEVRIAKRVRSKHDWRPVAKTEVGDAHTIAGLRVSKVRLHTRIVARPSPSAGRGETNNAVENDGAASREWTAKEQRRFGFAAGGGQPVKVALGVIAVISAQNRPVCSS